MICVVLNRHDIIASYAICVDKDSPTSIEMHIKMIKCYVRKILFSIHKVFLGTFMNKWMISNDRVVKHYLNYAWMNGSCVPNRKHLKTKRQAKRYDCNTQKKNWIKGICNFW